MQGTVEIERKESSHFLRYTTQAFVLKLSIKTRKFFFFLFTKFLIALLNIGYKKEYFPRYQRISICWDRISDMCAYSVSKVHS
jgi:hypothetical protein